MEKHFDVAALGEAMVEFNQTHPGKPHYLQGFGGDTSNAVIAAARAGAKTAYLTRLGQDTFGDALMELWQQEGVDTSGVERDAKAPDGHLLRAPRPQRPRVQLPAHGLGRQPHDAAMVAAGTHSRLQDPARLGHFPGDLT